MKRRILIGTYALSSGYYDKYYEQAQRVRSVIRNDFKEAFKKVDVILGPTTPSTAFPLKTELPVIQPNYIRATSIQSLLI